MKGVPTDMKNITPAKTLEICKGYNSMDKGMLTKCKSAELKDGLTKAKLLCDGKKVVAKTVYVEKIVKKKRVVATQGISKDFTLPKYKAEKENYEGAFLTASGARKADSTVKYTRVAPKSGGRRLAEGTSVANWVLYFDKDDQATTAAAKVSSAKFTEAVAKAP